MPYRFWPSIGRLRVNGQKGLFSGCENGTKTRFYPPHWCPTRALIADEMFTWWDYRSLSAKVGRESIVSANKWYFFVFDPQKGAIGRPDCFGVPLRENSLKVPTKADAYKLQQILTYVSFSSKVELIWPRSCWVLLVNARYPPKFWSPCSRTLASDY